MNSPKWMTLLALVAVQMTGDFLVIQARNAICAVRKFGSLASEKFGPRDQKT